MSMRVYISNTEMPKSCRRCDFSQPDGCGFICPIVVGKPIIDSLTHSRHARCPLIPIPPHGRLIDVNALCVTAIDITDLPVGECLMVYLKEDIDNAPTIIEAEEDE